MELIYICLNLFLKHFHDIYLSVPRLKKKSSKEILCRKKENRLLSLYNTNEKRQIVDKKVKNIKLRTNSINCMF